MKAAEIRMHPDWSDCSDSNSLEMIGNWIIDINQLAVFDFQMLNKLLKDYARLLPSDLNSVAADKVSEAVAALQRVDIFNQKLTHMKVLHSLANGIAISGSELEWHRYVTFIFRLNYFQAVVASFEFDAIVSSIRESMNKLYGFILKSSNVDFSGADYFAHHHLIVRKLTLLTSVLCDLFDKHAQPRMILESPPQERLLQIENIYTNESERFVLMWLIGNTHGTSADLLARYTARYEENVDDNGGVELF